MLKDECCICLENNLSVIKMVGFFNSTRLTCCGALICNSCNEELVSDHFKKTSRKVGYPCPLCRG